MNRKILEHAGFTVIGIEARTSNAREMTANGIIAKQWARFWGENLSEEIPNRIDSTILAVYSDYASDKDDEYSFLIGARVMPEERSSRRNGDAEYSCGAICSVHLGAGTGGERRGRRLAEDLGRKASGTRRGA